MISSCILCGNIEGNVLYPVKELQLGLGEDQLPVERHKIDAGSPAEQDGIDPRTENQRIVPCPSVTTSPWD